LVVRTYQQTTAQTDHHWYIVDAAGRRLGTLAVQIARALSGKHKPTWTPHIDDGDYVVVVNADKIELGGQKWKQKRLIENAVRGMLATNRTRDVQLRRLSVYTGAEHPHAAQNPQPLPATL
jgi:large subunit ribosomal protein L13